MTMGFYDQGKFFTKVVSKEAVAVIIQTNANRIMGYIHIRPGERLKDEINVDETFFAITDATVMDLNGNMLYQSEFIAVNRQQIVWLMPEDKLSPNS